MHIHNLSFVCLYVLNLCNNFYQSYSILVKISNQVESWREICKQTMLNFTEPFFAGNNKYK